MTGRKALNKQKPSALVNVGMKTRLKKLAIASALVALGQNVFGLGLGELNHGSSLGQPLDARIRLISPEKDYTLDELKVRHLNAEQAAHMGVELLSFFQRFDIKPAIKNGELYIELTSEDPVTEPFINLFIELKWPTGQVYREYTLLLDPPNIQLSQSAPAVSESRQTSARPSMAERATPSRPAPRSAMRRDSNLSQDDYRVRSGDSLSKIAQRFSRNTAYNYRDVMNWLLVNNPHAFIKGDPNRLKAAVRLTLPNEKTWSRVEAPKHQIEQPKARAQQSEVAPTAAPAIPVATEAPEAATQRQRFPDQQPTDDRLTLKSSTFDDSGSNDLDQLNQEQLKARIRGTKEQNDRLVRENKAIEARLKRLEGSDYIRSLERLVQLRDQEIAELKAVATEQRPGAVDGGNSPSSAKQSLIAVDSQLGAAAQADPVDSSAPAGQAEKPGEINNRLLLWVLLIAGAIGSAYFYFSSRRPVREIDYEETSYDKDVELAKLDEALADQDETVTYSEPEEQPDLSITTMFDEDGKPTDADNIGNWRPDPELTKKIKAKTKEYVPESPKGFHVVHHHEHDNLDDLISEALAYCAQGHYEKAEQMLVTEESTRGSESRINTALDYIRNLRDQAE